MPAKAVPYSSFPPFNDNIVKVDDISILQFAPSLESKNPDYIWKEPIFELPAIKVLGGFVDGDNHWLVFITDEKFVKLANILIFNDGKRDDNAIKSALATFEKDCIAALLVNLIPSWKELSKVLFEKKVFIKAQNPKVALQTSITTSNEAIEIGSKLLRILIDKAVEHNYPTLLRSLNQLEEIYNQEDVNPLMKELNIEQGIGISPKVIKPFFGKQIDFILSADELDQKPEQTIREGMLFDTGNFIPECFHYSGEFPNNVVPKFTPSSVPAKKSGGNWNSGGSTTVEYYKASQGIKDFISFMTDEQLRLLLKNFTEESIARICLGLSGVPSSIGKLETKNTKSNNEPLTSFFKDESDDSFLYEAVKPKTQEGEIDFDADETQEVDVAELNKAAENNSTTKGKTKSK